MFNLAADHQASDARTYVLNLLLIDNTHVETGGKNDSRSRNDERAEPSSS